MQTMVLVLAALLAATTSAVVGDPPIPPTQAAATTPATVAPATGTPATSAPTAPPAFAQRLPDARGVAYAARVAPGIYRGGVPDEEGIAWLKRLGIRTVINLRHHHGDREGRRVQAAGMRYERIALESSDPPRPEQVRRFLDLVSDPSLHPIYVHCLHGVDRTGALMAVYRMELDGWTREHATAEMDHFGPHAMWRDLKRFVRDYVPRRRAPKAPAPQPAPATAVAPSAPTPAP